MCVCVCVCVCACAVHVCVRVCQSPSNKLAYHQKHLDHLKRDQLSKTHMPRRHQHINSRQQDSKKCHLLKSSKAMVSASPSLRTIAEKTTQYESHTFTWCLVSALACVVLQAMKIGCFCLAINLGSFCCYCQFCPYNHNHYHKAHLSEKTKSKMMVRLSENTKLKMIISF